MHVTPMHYIQSHSKRNPVYTSYQPTTLKRHGYSPLVGFPLGRRRRLRLRSEHRSEGEGDQQAMVARHEEWMAKYGPVYSDATEDEELVGHVVGGGWVHPDGGGHR